jgi:hypothetical protein
VEDVPATAVGCPGAYGNIARLLTANYFIQSLPSDRGITIVGTGDL